MAAALAVAGGWHLVYNLPFTVVTWSAYRWPHLVAAAWLAYAVGVVIAAGAALGGRQPRWPWAWCGTTWLITAFVAAASPSPLHAANWAWGAAGWLAILVLWQRRFRDLLLFLAGNAVVSVVAVVASGHTDRTSLARTVIVLAGTTTLQLGFSGGARALRVAAGWAATAAAAHAETMTAAEIAEQSRHARSGRYEQIRRSTAELLAGMATGGADPADPEVRRQCSVQAGRLRRWLVEWDDLPAALPRELHACADTAERRGVAVDMSIVGGVPQLPAAVRRELAEPVIAALSAAGSRARVTVTTTADEVVVAVVADTGQLAPPPQPPPTETGVSLHWQHADAQLWVEVTAKRPQIGPAGWSGPAAPA